jgi:beta-galactosidase
MLLFNKIIVSLIFLQLLIPALSIPMKMYHDVKQLHSHVNKQFSLPDKIFAAEIHFSRIPYQYWEHRLQMVKAMGFNALSVYIMWNFH